MQRSLICIEKIGDGHDNNDNDDRSGNERFPCRWPEINKLSLNIKQTKYSFFHPISKANNLPLRLPILEINNNIIK